MFADPTTYINYSCTGVDFFTGCQPTYVNDVVTIRNIKFNSSIMYSTCLPNEPWMPGVTCCVMDLRRVFITTRVVAVAYWNTPTDCTGPPDGASDINMVIKRRSCTGTDSCP